MGKVRKYRQLCAFIEIEEGIDGLLHVSDPRGPRRSAIPADAQKGESVRPSSQRSIRRSSGLPWPQQMQKIRG